jgi:hypothetical protein
LNADPVLEEMDTMSMKGVFYKNNTEIYSNNSREEMYLQDSLMVEINNDRKAIWIRKVDVATKENLNLIPVNAKEMLEKFQKDYDISKSQVSEDISRLNFEQRIPEYSTSPTKTSVAVEYYEKGHLPKVIEIIIYMKQPVDEEILQAIREEGIDESKLIKVIDGIKQLFRKQTITIVFTKIDNDAGKLTNMPTYKSSVEFDETTKEFVGKGLYKDYTITKTF